MKKYRTIKVQILINTRIKVKKNIRVHFNDDIATLIRPFIAPAEIYVPSVTMSYFPMSRRGLSIHGSLGEVAHFLWASDIESQTRRISAGHLIHPIQNQCKGSILSFNDAFLSREIEIGALKVARIMTGCRYT